MQRGKRSFGFLEAGILHVGMGIPVKVGHGGFVIDRFIAHYGKDGCFAAFVPDQIAAGRHIHRSGVAVCGLSFLAKNDVISKQRLSTRFSARHTHGFMTEASEELLQIRFTVP